MLAKTVTYNSQNYAGTLGPSPHEPMSMSAVGLNLNYCMIEHPCMH